ncbi:RDD family protein [Gilvimarinus sp. SDUM040013]|uniref:RDD family protein n=1 Tax=Gilvimarinus gilvus TaxID=3058038 RepID=A0ABU4S1A5_9GAMM|nr:RDD family protein [Gilvimarinus sp. SDUM040013]MDO3388713.1 RDD family protein [Gilvimarinus sp. SDUM040013]MDX6849608.1 RDD family protein [Gilvimarinus sp. SDUM040013]
MTEQENRDRPADTLEYITPHALNINNSLIGLPLARPAKRLLAITVDLALIALLTNLAVGWIIFIVVIVFLRYFRKSGHTVSFIPHASRALVLKTLKPIVLLVAALFIVVVAIGTAAWFVFGDQLKHVNFHGVDLSSEVSPEQAIGVNVFLVAAENTAKFSECESLACWQSEYFYLSASFPDLQISKESAKNIYPIFAEFTNLSSDEQSQLVSFLLKNYGVKMTEHPQADQAQVAEVHATPFSLIDWLVSLMKDLGLGVSWMAIYFTLFTSVANGQTPGKRLCGIKVVKLDASSITFWDSFFRYGGYAAGITTGLLGYLQIYWDANRQAIQDKISATVVVDLRKQVLDAEQVRHLCG